MPFEVWMKTADLDRLASSEANWSQEDIDFKTDK